MNNSQINIMGWNIPVISIDTAIVGSGAAGFQAADRLWHLGRQDIAIITEGRHCGTSRNTGSDKQTYYKLSLSGEDMDSVRLLAKSLMDGGCVDGDTALCEAALSTECFLHLVELGVEFPRNRYGEYIGYKTDHDPYRRATSVGPYTSKRMTEVLEKSITEKGIPVFDAQQAIRLLTCSNHIAGVLCCTTHAGETDSPFTIFLCNQLIMATGAPAGMYRDSVYPISQFGASGIVFEAGAAGKNLTEWQHGLASISPRWNVSGTYMQCLPRFYSVGVDGIQHEFLSEFFNDRTEMLANIFMKGYQWPFDASRLSKSSLIDLLVFIETRLNGRHVYLDFTHNPDCRSIDFAALPEEPRKYLENGGAFQQSPFERLNQLNRPAIDFYLDHGIDLSKDALEIAICVQHNNGGIEVDCWWQTGIQGLFAVGELAGTHGVTRPGGSALNAGQVGALRAAQWISHLPEKASDPNTYQAACLEQITDTLDIARNCAADKGNVQEYLQHLRTKMSTNASAIRNKPAIEVMLAELTALRIRFTEMVRFSGSCEMALMYRLRDMIISQILYLSAMLDYIENGHSSRGGALYTDKNGVIPDPKLPECFRCCVGTSDPRNKTQIVRLNGDKCEISWRNNRAMPSDDLFFENVWRDYRATKNIY